jgi:lipopolysaccharide export system protein LptA
MPISISRLRRWFAIGAVLVVLAVAGTYFYARWRVRKAVQHIPPKLGIEVQQTANQFTVSRSEQGRTVFKIQASKAVQYKQGGHTELHDVTITLYGRDSSRFDQIYGSDFEYNPQAGDVTAKGQVQIDLDANPQGVSTPDQSPPKELKNPIHLVTSGLVFNQKTGNAQTTEKVEFRIPQATGSAVGVSYVSKNNTLTLHSLVHVIFDGSTPATVTASDGVITKEPRQVILNHPKVDTAAQEAQAEKTILFLRPDNSVERVLATGNVQTVSRGPQPSNARADQLELLMTDQAQQKDLLRTATFTGNVHINENGKQPMQGSAGRVLMDFVGRNLVSKVHAEDNVHLVQHQAAASAANPAQELELTASTIDFYFKDGRRLDHGQTSGAAQIAIRPASAKSGQQTVVTAGKFTAHFDDSGRLGSVHGEPDARIVTSTPGQPDRVSSSAQLDATFRSGGGIESIIQQGNMAYVDGDRKAWADKAVYTPSDQTLLLTGSPRVIEGGMTTSSRLMRLNRATGDASSEGDVKSSYSDLKPQPNGALLASGSPIHVTAENMTAHRSPAVAVYSGNARLWQDANVVEAPTIEFDRNRRLVSAQGPQSKSVSTVIVQTDKSGKATPVTINSPRLVYSDSDRTARFEGGVTAKGTDTVVTATRMDVLLQARGEQATSKAVSEAGKLERITAQGQVVVTQPNRRAVGDRLVYLAGEDKFVLSGGSPSIFDAERGKITGVSLTFFRHDDRVVVEGNDTSPTVTQTRVAR